MRREIAQAQTALIQKIRSILDRKKLTIAQVSQRSKVLYGPASAYFIPHNYYYELHRATFSPSVYQIAALSRISGFRLSHWLQLFGFDLEDIPRMQIHLPNKRTKLLDSSLVDPDAQIRFLQNKGEEAAIPNIAPLGRFLKWEEATPLQALVGTEAHRFLYAKIGQEDALAFPELLPGSIVRVNRAIPSPSLLAPRQGASGLLYLIAHSKGLFCCHLRAVGRDVLAPLSTKLPYGQVELRIPDEIRVLGFVDLEIRSTAQTLRAEVPVDLAKRWTPGRIDRKPRLDQLLPSSRSRMNLSLHATSALSRQIAELLRDDRYFLSPSTLSDYEIQESAPRHIHKIISLCAIYGLGFRDFLHSSGISERELGVDPMPRDLSPATGGRESQIQRPARQAGFLAEVVNRWGEVPLFLRRSIKDLSGLPNPSLEDFFWIGSEKRSLHPYLEDALLIVVNPRKKKPVHYRDKPLWEQPIYLLLRRDGDYLCGCCSLEEGNLVIHPYPQQLHRPIQFRNYKDAEVIGQIVAVAKRIV